MSGPVLVKSPIPFRPFDENGEIRIYEHGVLPHWRQSGCTYFVTFRLTDSIPEAVLNEIAYERSLWLKGRGIDPARSDWKYKFAKLPGRDRRVYEQLVGRLLHRSLDECHGACVLREPALGGEVATALEHFHGSRVLTGDLVIMPNHVHALLTPQDGFELEDILHSIKSFTANGINRALNKSGRLWQRETYDHIVRDAEQLHAYQEYIAANPVKAKLAAGQYTHTRATYEFIS